MWDWQLWTALAIVAAAACALLRHFTIYLSGGERTGCAHCPSKSQPSGVKSLPLVEIAFGDTPKKKKT